MSKFYSKDNYKHLRRVIANWKNYNHVIKRTNIFKTIINILKSKLSDKDKAITIIPLLLANLDGAIKDMYVELNLTETANFAKHNKMLKKMLENLLKSHIFLGGNFLKVVFLLFCYEKGLSIGKDIEILNFTKADCEKDYKNILNRNSILHGKFVDYGSKIELIRLVIFFDVSIITIQNILDNRN